METFGIFATLAAGVAFAGAASAQGFEHKRSEVELGYQSTNFDSGGSDVSLDEWTIDGRTD